MDVEQAARLLSGRVDAPRGAVSIAAWYEQASPEIMVWYDPQYVRVVSGLPSTFEGYRVVVKARPRFFAA
jgi:hypothetical protein